MLSSNERSALYTKCNIAENALCEQNEMTIPLISLKNAHLHKELLSSFSGEHAKIGSNPSKAAFAVSVVDTDMSERFLPGTLLLVEPNLKPKNGNFVLAYLYEAQKILFRQYILDEDDIELHTTDDEADPISFTYQDRVIGVVTETKFYFPQ